MPDINATERAWKLNIAKAKKCAYVIAIVNGRIHAYFNLHSTFVDGLQPDRIAFKLSACNNRQKGIINSLIRGQNLGRFTTKYF